jgi:hypothetical protein
MAVSSKAESRMSSPRGYIVGNLDLIAKGNVGESGIGRQGLLRDVVGRFLKK